MTPSLEQDNYSYYIDSHCHFDFAQFDEDRPNIWQECAARNIRQLVIPGVAPDQWAQAEKLCRKFCGIFFAAGLHPWWIAEYLQGFASHDQAMSSLMDKQEKWLKEDYCVAIGECGMDKTIDTPLAVQQSVFAQQLRLAKSAALPLIVHSLKTHNEVLKIIKDENFNAFGVVHAFSGSRQIAEDFIAEGFFIGVGGTITYERAAKTRDAVTNVPLDRIILETDAPDMPLSGRQGKRNSPVCVEDVGQTLAQLRDEDIDTIMTQTSQNAASLFKLNPQNINQVKVSA